MAFIDIVLSIVTLLNILMIVNEIISTHRMERITRTEDFRQRARCFSVVLFPDREYLFESNAVGNFRIRGGFTNNITVDGNMVTILDFKDDQTPSLYFRCGSTNDRVELKDVDGITTVSLIRNGARRLNRPKEDAIFKYQFKEDEILVNQDLSSDDNENPRPLQIVGHPDEGIIIAGHRPAIVTGNGGYLKKMGTNSVTVRGNLQRVTQKGTSTVIVHGNVTGDVVDEDLGSINIEGDVHGTILSGGMGSIIVKGNVHGDIYSKGYSSVEVLGRHLNGGVVFIEDYGHVSVGGVGSTSFLSKVLRFF